MACSSRSEIFDEVRKIWVKATPEERIRQTWMLRMVRDLSYPRALLAVEKELKELPHLQGKQVPARRVDLICYGHKIHSEHLLYPLLMLECKKVLKKNDAIHQIMGYNHFVRAYFIAVADADMIQTGYLCAERKQYVFVSGLPPYPQLIDWVTARRGK